MQEFERADHLRQDPAALREQAYQNGYLFFKGLVDREQVLGLRRQVFEICRERGWLDPDAPVSDGVAAEGVLHLEGQPEFMQVYNRLLALEDFNTMAHSPGILEVTSHLFNEPTLVHARTMARIIFPRAELHTTSAHQDFVHVQGTPETWTAWIPLGDCPTQQGGLTIMAGSHRHGIYPVRAAYGVGGVGIDTDSLPYEWHSGDFEAGDVLFFHSHTVHKGLPNLTPDRIRLSVDYRYQPISHPVTRDSFQPHLKDVSWEEIYQGWSGSRLKYYWKSLPIHWSEWTPEYHQLAGAAAGEAGD